MAMRNPREVMPSPGPCDGRLSPWADTVVGGPGWQATTQSRRLAVAVAAAISGATVYSHGKGQWQARIPCAVLMVVVIDAGADALRCHLGPHPDSSVFALAFAPWPAATVLNCPAAALPAQGRLSVREVRVITRMGRTVRYMLPEFTTPLTRPQQQGAFGAGALAVQAKFGTGTVEPAEFGRSYLRRRPLARVELL